jgi:hypothetical protein
VVARRGAGLSGTTPLVDRERRLVNQERRRGLSRASLDPIELEALARLAASR